jgi:predicted short-subunit dehydrogenase-like oxidoreductase (DUF2520 family)
MGIGRLGGALTIALSKKGFEIENLIVKNPETAVKIAELIEPAPKILSADEFSEISSDVILIATQDFEIANVARKLKETLKNKSNVFHTSGALSSEILNDLKEIGCRVGSIHPLVSVSDARLGADRFANAYFCVEGDSQAVEIAEEIVEKLGGKSFSIAAEHKALYHASAVTACGHLVALIDAAIEILSRCGLEEKTAQKILLPLIESTVENLETQTTAEALTGTIARGDVQTLEKHLEVLEKNVSSEALEIYVQLAARSVNLARERGANLENLKKISEKLLLAKSNLR